MPHRHAPAARALSPGRPGRGPGGDRGGAARRGGRGARWTPHERAAVFLRAADLLAGPWRQTLNAATMLGQSKTVPPGGDRRRLRDDRLLALQPVASRSGSSPSSRSRRPGSGTGSSTGRSRGSSSRSRRSTSPPSRRTSRPRRRSWATPSSGSRPRRRCYSGVPPREAARGGRAPARRRELRARAGPRGGRPGAREPGPRRAPLHRLHRGVPGDVAHRRREPRPLPHLPAARRRDRRQGLRLRPPVGGRGRARRWRSCAARSSTRGRSARPPRAPTCRRALWPQLRERLLGMAAEIKVGEVEDFRTSWAPSSTATRSSGCAGYVEIARASSQAKILAAAGRTTPRGFFVEPTVVETVNPRFQLMEEEIFGPVLTVYVYADIRLDEALELCAHDLAVRPHRRDLRARPRGDRRPDPQARGRGGQLLRERQADRRGGRPAAVRRRARVRDERQGGVHGEPAPLDVAARHQGDLRPAHPVRVPVDARAVSAARRACGGRSPRRVSPGPARWTLRASPGSPASRRLVRPTASGGGTRATQSRARHPDLPLERPRATGETTGLLALPTAPPVRSGRGREREEQGRAPRLPDRSPPP